MVSFPAFITRPLTYGAAFAAVLALGHSAAHAQVAPTPAPARPSVSQNVAYYVDGKPTTQAEVNRLAANNIQSMNVVKGAEMQQLGLAPGQEGAVLITTKAKANSPEVAAFNQRFPVTPATPAQNEAVAAAQAYLKQHYPAAKVEAIMPAKNQAGRYTAIFTDNGQRLQLLFDGQGSPVAQ